MDSPRPFVALNEQERDALILTYLKHLTNIMKVSQAATGELRKERAKRMGRRLIAIIALME